jgi:hypothetical protein
MTLPGKNEKGYLAVVDRADGFAITARPRHAEELAAILAQHGVACRKEEAGPDEHTLVFDAGADRGRVEAVLRGYEEAKGS